MPRQEFTTVSIPTSLADKVKKHIEGTSFYNLSNYVTYLLREVLIEAAKSEETYSKKDKENLKRKLRGLGY